MGSHEAKERRSLISTNSSLTQKFMTMTEDVFRGGLAFFVGLGGLPRANQVWPGWVREVLCLRDAVHDRF